MCAASRAAVFSLKSIRATSKKPVSHWFLSLTESHSVITRRRKSLTVIWSLHLLHPYEDKMRFKIYTDNDILKWILNLNTTIARLVQRYSRQFEFGFDGVNRPSISHQTTNTLSQIISNWRKRKRRKSTQKRFAATFNRWWWQFAHLDT